MWRETAAQICHYDYVGQSKSKEIVQPHGSATHLCLQKSQRMSPPPSMVHLEMNILDMEQYAKNPHKDN